MEAPELMVGLEPRATSCPAGSVDEETRRLTAKSREASKARDIALT